MPKLKPSDNEVASRITRAAISNNMDLYGVSEDFLSAKAGVTVKTIQNKRKRPETLTLEELWLLSKTLKLTPIQAASIVLGRTLSSKEIKEFILM